MKSVSSSPSVPALVGWKTTLILQLAPGSRLVPPVGEQLFVDAGTTAKSAPLRFSPPVVKGSFPVFFSTMVRAADVLPTCTVPKINPVLESVGIACPVAVPVKYMAFVKYGAATVIDAVVACGPGGPKGGLKVIKMLHEAPAASVMVPQPLEDAGCTW